jgi:hypothetical protein
MRGKKVFLFSMTSATVDVFVRSLFFCDIVLYHCFFYQSQQQKAKHEEQITWWW